MAWLCRVYGEAIPVKELADRVASYVHLCTLYWWLRFSKYLMILLVIILIIFPLLNGVCSILWWYLLMMQTFWIWSNSWRLWQRWATIIHGWTFGCFLCELIFVTIYRAVIIWLINDEILLLLSFNMYIAVFRICGGLFGILFILWLCSLFCSRGTLVLRLAKADRLLKRKLQFVCLTVLLMDNFSRFKRSCLHPHPPQKGKKDPMILERSSGIPMLFSIFQIIFARIFMIGSDLCD